MLTLYTAKNRLIKLLIREIGLRNRWGELRTSAPFGFDARSIRGCRFGDFDIRACILALELWDGFGELFFF